MQSAETKVSKTHLRDIIIRISTLTRTKSRLLFMNWTRVLSILSLRKAMRRHWFSYKKDRLCWNKYRQIRIQRTLSSSYWPCTIWQCVIRSNIQDIINNFFRLGILEDCAICLEACLANLNGPYLQEYFNDPAIPSLRLKMLKYKCKTHM